MSNKINPSTLTEEDKESILSLANAVSGVLSPRVSAPTVPGAFSSYLGNEMSSIFDSTEFKEWDERDKLITNELDWLNKYKNIMFDYTKDDPINRWDSTGELIGNNLNLSAFHEFQKSNIPSRYKDFFLTGDADKGYDLTREWYQSRKPKGKWTGTDILSSYLPIGKETSNVTEDTAVQEFLSRILAGKRGLFKSDRDVFLDEEGNPMTNWGFKLFGIPIGGLDRPISQKKYEKLKNVLPERFFKNYSAPLQEIISGSPEGIPLRDENTALINQNLPADVQGALELQQTATGDMLGIADLVKRLVIDDEYGNRGGIVDPLTDLGLNPANISETVNELMSRGVSPQEIIQNLQGEEDIMSSDLVSPKYRRTFPGSRR